MIAVGTHSDSKVMADVEVLNANDVLEALRLWHGGEVPRWPLAHLRLGLKVSNEQEAHSSLAEAGPAAHNRAILSQGLEVLRSVSPEAEDLLRERFEHRRDALAVANSLNITEASLYYRQRQAVHQLTGILIQLEESASAEWQERMLARLELQAYDHLVGIEETRKLLFDALMNPNGQFIVAIDGLGGIGKTTIADRVTRDVIRTTRFDEVAWITAKHTHLSTLGRLQVESGRPALTFRMLIDKLSNQFEFPESSVSTQLQRQRMVKNFLRNRACLVIIDNLETVADYHNLLPELQKWQKPSKFLLTSRLRLLDEPGVFSVSMKELSEVSAFQLMRNEARRTGFTALMSAEDEELRQIYEAVGGNPLALKLVIGQLRFHSLPHVLERFAGGQEMESGEGLFDYIYREIWESLDDDSKITLLALTQAGETGFTFDHLAAVSSLPEPTLYQCLEDLVLLSLVDLGGSLTERRYRLHRLTEVFLLRMFDEV
ncbi:MAG: NB-ARC domain-containing protein [Anaerolineae bacterium]